MSNDFNWNKVLEPEESEQPRQKLVVEEGSLPNLEFNSADSEQPSLGIKPVSQDVHKIEVNNMQRFELEQVPGGRYTDQETLDPADYHIDEILRMALEKHASDIHITANLPPTVRVDGELVQLNFLPLTPRDCRRLVYDTLSDEQLEKFETSHELDFGYAVKGLGRFRFNAYQQRGSVAGALRSIPTKIPPFEVLGLPNIIRDMSNRTSGLVLITGPTGSGKSTTIASIIDEINERRPRTF